MVDFCADDTPQLKAWREEVRTFLQTELPNGMHFDFDFEEDPDRWAECMDFWQKVGRKGWIALTWSPEYYGLGRSAAEHWILQEEFAEYGAPVYPIIGMQVAAALLRHGTHEQRRRHLKGIAEATVLWGEGYTEPQAGSDLASLTTRATLDGDEWVINGQKTFGTAAHMAPWMFVLARSDPQSSRHKGISAFLVPLDAPGVTMLPMHNIANGRQNATFFDDVRVPKDCLVGTPGNAWNQIWFGMGGDSLMNGAPGPDHWYARMTRTLKLLRRFVAEGARGGRPLSDDPIVRLQMAELEVEVETARLCGFEMHSNVVTGSPRAGSHIYTINLQQAYIKELYTRFAQGCMDVMGPLAQVQHGPWAPMAGLIEQQYRAAFGNHAGGTSQLKRMTLATRGLELPR
jgi:alkylation response protein AidB-like acyl-CoA dehydrogenase